MPNGPRTRVHVCDKLGKRAQIDDDELTCRARRVLVVRPFFLLCAAYAIDFCQTISLPALPWGPQANRKSRIEKPNKSNSGMGWRWRHPFRLDSAAKQ